MRSEAGRELLFWFISLCFVLVFCGVCRLFFVYYVVLRAWWRVVFGALFGFLVIYIVYCLVGESFFVLLFNFFGLGGDSTVGLGVSGSVDAGAVS